MRFVVFGFLLVISSANNVIAASNAGCPSYTDYSSVPHGPYSTGKYKLPSMRPLPRCRTFSTPTVENIIQNVTSAITDPDWQQLFTNIFPNTLDTTVAWHNPDAKEPYTFLVTGDITAQWIRDSANQVLPYIPYAAQDKDLANLILGLINMQAEELAEYPFGNAFQPPPRSGLQPQENGIGANLSVYPPYNNATVFEAKFELDSFASFFQLTTAYWRATGDARFLKSKSWSKAMAIVMDVASQLQEPTYSMSHRVNPPTLSYKRRSFKPTETQFGNGIGNPVKYTGMCKTLFRPSDDATIFPFLVPSNAFMSVELQNLSHMLGQLKAHPDHARMAQIMADEIRKGIFDYGTTVHPTVGRVFVFETDGYGSNLIMDDTNGPALLSLPYLGFVKNDDPVYQNTRKLILSPDTNPWYFTGPVIRGVGSPHTGFLRVWPMALAMRGLTSENKGEIRDALDQLKATTSGLGLMHESVSVLKPDVYTRSWFAWCNSLASQLVVDATRRFPGII